MIDEPAIATHPNPAWGRPESVMLRADLGAFGMPGRWEQLWTSQVSANGFEICCIPFFTYGMALGDVVEAGARQGERWVVERVVSRSGHRNLRVALESADVARELHEELHDIAARTGLAHEWHGAGYLAIDLPPSTPSHDILALFAEHSEAGRLAVEVDD